MNASGEVGRTSFQVGKESSDFLSVAIIGNSYPAADDFWDGNWLNARVELAAGGFRGTFHLFLRTTDFEPFRDGLEALHRSLTGEARFETLEEQLKIEVEGDGRGHFEARCVAMDQAGVGNQLSFRLQFDQTEIPGIIRGLEAIVSAFPTKGQPTD